MKETKTGSSKKRITTRDLSKKAVKGKGVVKKRSVVMDCGGTSCEQLRIIHVPHATELIINLGCLDPDGVFITKQPLKRSKKKV